MNIVMETGRGLAAIYSVHRGHIGGMDWENTFSW